MVIRQLGTLSLPLAMLLLVARPSSAQKLVPSANRGAVQLGLRLGYGVPFGKVGRTTLEPVDTDVSSGIKGQVPLGIDAGYLVSPNVYVGLLFQYGFGFKGNIDNPFCNQRSCSTTDVSLGIGAHYHLKPAASFDPWIGLAVGYEWLSLAANSSSMGSFTFSSSGFQYVNIQLGCDVGVAPNLAAGPFVSVSTGQYASSSAEGGSMTLTQDITNQSFHEWLLFGVRGVYNIRL